MKISINQPAYFPWLGYFDRIDYADLHVVLDHVQFEKNSFINRNRIISNQGFQWVTIPITKGENGDKSINKMRCLNNKWIDTHIKSMRQNYSKTPFFSDYFEVICDKLIDKKDSLNFIDIVESVNKLLLGFLGINTPIIYSSELNLSSRKSDLVLDICLSQKAKFYLSGVNGKDYLNEGKFKQYDVKILFQSYQHPNYNQNRDEFIPFLSIIDLLFNHGPDSLEIIRKGRNFLK